MKSEHFDQVEGSNYGNCLGCETTFATQELMYKHLSDTYDKSKNSGHRARVTNPTRAERIEQQACAIVEEAIDKMLDEIDQLVLDEAITEEEAKEALRTQTVDLSQEYSDYIEANR